MRLLGLVVALFFWALQFDAPRGMVLVAMWHQVNMVVREFSRWRTNGSAAALDIWFRDVQRLATHQNETGVTPPENKPKEFHSFVGCAGKNSRKHLPCGAEQSCDVRENRKLYAVRKRPEALAHAM